MSINSSCSFFAEGFMFFMVQVLFKYEKHHDNVNLLDLFTLDIVDLSRLKISSHSCKYSLKRKPELSAKLTNLNFKYLLTHN